MGLYSLLGEEYVEVVDIFEGDWEWQIFTAWFNNKTNKYYWYGESGCSCDNYGDYVETLSELEYGDREALLRAVKSWYHNEITPQYLNTVAKIKNFNPLV